jgi:hypothetical protein
MVGLGEREERGEWIFRERLSRSDRSQFGTRHSTAMRLCHFHYHQKNLPPIPLIIKSIVNPTG